MIGIVVGIDPGESGGMATVDGFGRNIWLDKFKSKTESEIWRRFQILRTETSVHAFIEHVHSFPRQGVSSTFKFGRHYGMLRAFLTAAEIPFETVSPGVWQRGMGCLSKGDKKVTRAKAQELFPSSSITHSVADALLIAEWGRRILAGRSE